MSSEIVIVWQAEEPIRYRPQQTNLMRIRTKSSELSLFNPKKTTIYEREFNKQVQNYEMFL